MDAIWIPEYNLEPCLEVLASLAGAVFDADDRAAVAGGLHDTNFETDRWFSYEFSGRESVNFRAAYDKGTCVLFMAVTAAPAIEAEFGPVLRLAQSYRFTRDSTD